MTPSAPALPRLYAIVDAALFAQASSEPAAAMAACAAELATAGVSLLQYRDKQGSAQDVLERLRALRRAAPGARLILNDRADLCLAAGCDGVHLGQDDLSPQAARGLFSSVRGGERLWVGVSTHSVEHVREADRGPADYLAIGPVFATGSKERPDPVVGLEGVRAARAATGKPLVAIGGITRANCRAVLEAGADSVAVISDLLAGGSPRRAAEEFLALLGAAERVA
jgi:thiamine-phosphate pyrophosphorylase